METEFLVDQVFMYLSTMKDPYIFPRALENKLDIRQANPTMLLDTIYEIGFASKEKNSQQSIGGTQAIYNYALNSNGIIFVSKLPDGFKDRPYTFYRKMQLDNDEKSVNNAELQKRFNELTVEKLLNDKENASLKRQLDETILKLSKAQHADIPKNEQYRDKILIWQIATGVSVLIAFLLKLFGVKGWL